jgi:hypothetical protein
LRIQSMFRAVEQHRNRSGRQAGACRGAAASGVAASDDARAAWRGVMLAAAPPKLRLAAQAHLDEDRAWRRRGRSRSISPPRHAVVARDQDFQAMTLHVDRRAILFARQGRRTRGYGNAGHQDSALYVVATPIGNLGDIGAARAGNVLRGADLPSPARTRGMRAGCSTITASARRDLLACTSTTRAAAAAER